MDNDNDDWFVVSDIENFTKSTRTLVYNNFADWNKGEDDIVNSMQELPEDDEEFNKLLSQEESIIIVKNSLRKQRSKKTNDIRYLVCNSLFYQILEELNSRMVSNTIGSLVKRGLVESAYDDELNDFVFWVNENNKELPE